MSETVDVIGGALALMWLAMFAGMLAESGVHALCDWRHHRRARPVLPVARVVR